MRAVITGIDTKQSKFGGHFFYVYLKNVGNGKSYKTCLYPKCRNFKNWANVLSEGVILDNLIIKKDNLVDADSIPQEVQ